MNIYIICSVRDADDELRKRLEAYTESLEWQGHKVHLPHRDTNQKARGIEICAENRAATEWADEIHIFYSPESQGSHFDLGLAFMARKKLVVAGNVEYEPGKSFARMIEEWQEEGPE